MNLAKLNQLRDDHARLHAAYRDVAERARTAASDVLTLRNSLAPTGTPEKRVMRDQFLQLPIAELVKQPFEAVGIPRAFVEKLLAAQSRADSLKREAEVLAPALRRSSALIEKLNAYAQD